MELQFHEVVKSLNDQGIDVWGWHVPRAAAVDAGKEEAQPVASLAEQFNVIGDGGGCSSASACAERAIIFMRLVRDQGFPGYSFWHWFGAPPNLWEVLFTEPV